MESINSQQAPTMQENPAMAASIQDLNLPVRLLNPLRRLKLNTLGDLCKLSEDEIMLAHNVGPYTLGRIKQALLDKGLALRERLSGRVLS